MLVVPPMIDRTMAMLTAAMRTAREPAAASAAAEHTLRRAVAIAYTRVQLECE